MKVKKAVSVGGPVSQDGSNTHFAGRGAWTRRTFPGAFSVSQLQQVSSRQGSAREVVVGGRRNAAAADG